MMLIHLSNVYLDRIFPSLTNPILGTHRRERLKKILEEIVEAGIRRKAEGLLIAGNLLSDKWITDDTVKWLVDLFESLKPIKVFISPGESDCICEDSVYLYQTFPENVFIFSKPEWEVFVDKESSLCVVGYGKWRDGNYLDKPPEMYLSRETNNVCLACDLEFDVEGVFSVPNTSFSYVALGNTLSEEKKVLSNDVVVCNSGAVEQFDFFQKGAPGFYCIHFAFSDGGWKVSDVERLSVKGSTTYRELMVDCSSYVDAESLLHELVLMIKDIPSPRIVRVKLVGSISLSVFDEVMSNLGEVGKECDELMLSVEVDFIEVLEKSGKGLPFLVDEFYNAMIQDMKLVPSDRERRIIQRAGYLVLSAREGRKPVAPFGMGD